MTQVEFDKFVVKIMAACTALGFEPKTKEANENELRRNVIIC
jgi:hypothetical protein